jgi:hypothetical protein
MGGVKICGKSRICGEVDRILEETHHACVREGNSLEVERDERHSIFDRWAGE